MNRGRRGHSRRAFVIRPGTICLAIATAGCVQSSGESGLSTTTENGQHGNETVNKSNEETIDRDWETYRNDQFHFEVRYPADLTVREVPSRHAFIMQQIAGSSDLTAKTIRLFTASKGEERLYIGHSGVPLDEFTRSVGGVDRQVGEEAAIQVTPFARRQIAGTRGFDFQYRRYSGTGAGNEGESCVALGMATGDLGNGTVYLLFERCVPTIDSDPEITPSQRSVFEAMVTSFTFDERDG